MARYPIRITRIANLFHFVNNMAAWHFSCRKRYNEAWIAETGELDEHERQALASYASIAQRYPYGDRWLGRHFILAENEDDAWARASAALPRADFQQLRAAFDSLGPRFEIIWRKDHLRLEAVREKLDELLASSSVDAALEALERFFQTAAPSVTIDLLISRGGGSSGGANEAPDHITLEVLDAQDLWRGVEVALHEIAHLMEEPHFRALCEQMSDRYGLKGLTGSGSRGWAAHTLLREAIIGALAPGGCLSPFLGRPVDDHQERARRARERGDLRVAGLHVLRGALIPLVRSYVEAGRAVDRDFFEEAYRILVECKPELG